MYIPFDCIIKNVFKSSVLFKSSLFLFHSTARLSSSLKPSFPYKCPDPRFCYYIPLPGLPISRIEIQSCGNNLPDPLPPFRVSQSVRSACGLQGCAVNQLFNVHRTIDCSLCTVGVGSEMDRNRSNMRIKSFVDDIFPRYFLPSATKLRRLCFYRRVSVHTGGLPQCMLGYHTHIPKQTSPGSRHPLEQTSLRADTPPGSRQPPKRRPLLRRVRILLVCILF